MLNPDFRDILLCLKEEKVEFIIVGAYALAAHGLPRATGDLDIWIKRSPDNAHRTVRALKKFGAPMSDISEKDLAVPDSVIQLGIEPCRIDLLTAIDAVDFNEAWANKVKIGIDDLELFVLSKTDLLKNKLAANRDKDQSDIAWLKRTEH